MKAVPIYLNNNHTGSLRLPWFRAICRPLIRFATVTLACLSILVMGSENIWFPWPNLAGACVLVTLLVLCRQTVKRSDF